MRRDTPCVALEIITLFTTFATASTRESAPNPARPITRGRIVVWSNPDTMKNALAPSTATPPRPAARAVSVGAFVAVDAGVVAWVIVGRAP